MKILFITPRVPYPLDKGDRLRVFHQIRELSTRHEVGLFAHCTGAIQPHAEDVLRSLCADLTISSVRRTTAIRNAGMAALRGLPAQVGFFTDRLAKQRLAKMTHAFVPDVAFFQLARMGEYASVVECPRVLDYMDCFSEGLRQRAKQSDQRGLSFALQLEQQRMSRYEQTLASRFHGFTAISQRDITNLNCPHPVSLVPNGVDLDQYSPQGEIPGAFDGDTSSTDLLFVGNLEYKPNILAIKELVEQVLPRVQERRPATTLRIAGKNPPAWLQRLENPYLEVCGWAEDAASWYRSAKVFVAPMPVATGVQNKILQALACGTPCVATPIAAEPLLTSGAPIRCADAAGFTGTILELLESPQLLQRLSAESRHFAEEKLAWSWSALALESVLEAARKGALL